MNGLGKPGAREPHARFDEGRLETEPRSRDRSACNEVRGQRRTTSGHRASLPLYRRQTQSLRRSLHGLQREGFRRVFVLNTPEAVEAAEVTREPMRVDLRHERGPFDIIGDIHGCFDELTRLLEALGYQKGGAAPDVEPWRHPDGRKAVFLGDLVDRGPGIRRFSTS
jgi:Calcineurin-like phosphoesterase